MDREVVHALLGLFDQRVPIHLPGEFFRPAPCFFERLINGNCPDRHRRISQDPFASFVNVAAGGQIHHRICSPGDAPAHFLDFIFDGTRDRAVADVGVDLHQEVAADDHRFGFGVIDICGNDGSTARDLVANKFRRDVFRNARPERLAGMLETKTRPVVGSELKCLLSTEIFADCHEFHFRSDDAPARITQLRHCATIRGFPGLPLQTRECLMPHAALTLLSVFEAEIPIIFRTNFTAFVFQGVAAFHNPLQT